MDTMLKLTYLDLELGVLDHGDLVLEDAQVGFTVWIALEAANEALEDKT